MLINSQVINATQLYLPNNVKYHGAQGNGVTDDTTAIQATLNYVAGLGGGIVYFPCGTYMVTAPPATRVAVNEGAAFMLTSIYSNITLTGESENCAYIRPMSNRVEVFAIIGAANTIVQHLTFDNSQNGILNTLLVKGNTPRIANTGAAGIGTNANGALRQYNGTNLTVRFCRFIDFANAIQYMGTSSTPTVATGDFTVSQTFIKGSSFGILTWEPRTISLTDIECRDTTSNLYGDPDDEHTQEGHCVYIASQFTPPAETLIIANFRSYNDSSCPIKVRKGMSVAISNIAMEAASSGLCLINLRNATVVGVNVNIYNLTTTFDSKRAGLYCVDCGYTLISDVNIYMIDQPASGIQIYYALGNLDYHNRGVVVSNVKVHYNNAAGTTYGPFRISDQRNGAYSDLRAFHYGSIASDLYPVTVSNSSNITISFPAHYVIEGYPADAAKLVQLTSTTTNSWVWWRSADLSVPIASNTIDDDGTLNNVDNPAYGDTTGKFLAKGTDTTNPEFSFLNDLDTGMYRSSANHLSFKALGIQILELNGASADFIGDLKIGPLGDSTRPTLSYAANILDLDKGLRGAGGYRGGTATVTYTLGAANIVGTGATAVCRPSHVCDSVSQTIDFTTGTGISTTGTALTITTGITRLARPNCAITFIDTVANTLIDFDFVTTTTTIVITNAAQFTVSTAYRVTNLCFGI